MTGTTVNSIATRLKRSYNNQTTAEKRYVKLNVFTVLFAVLGQIVASLGMMGIANAILFVSLGIFVLSVVILVATFPFRNSR